MGTFIFCFVMATSATLVSAQYGKARVRLFKTKKTDTKHFVTNYTVQVLLSGPQFESSFTRSDNSLVIPTDTVKNTIYFKARESFSSPEEFAHLIANHFLGFKHVETVRVEITETMWNRMIVKGSEHPHSLLDPLVKLVSLILYKLDLPLSYMEESKTLLYLKQLNLVLLDFISVI